MIEYKIADGVIISQELGYPEYRFRIMDSRECIPGAYMIWNVRKEILPEGYIPLCRLVDCQPFPGGRTIDTDTLLAVKVEGANVIMDAVGFGPDTLETMEKFVEENHSAKPGTIRYSDLKKVERALPYMRQLRWC